MIYTKKEYCKAFSMCDRTLRNRIEKGNLPSFHKVKNLDGRGFVIITDQCELCNVIEKACREYALKTKFAGNPELAAELSIKYGINTARFFRTIGL
jgi:NAD-dependent dihydropyrimidine dehydrogenase PreA subunit